MQSALLNSAPKRILHGIRDESARELPTPPREMPVHLPHVFFFSEKGPDVEYISPDEFQEIFGSKALDVRSKYVTHQVPLIQQMISRGNAMVAQRLCPEDAGPPSRLRVGIEVTTSTTEIDAYERDESGDVVLDDENEPTLSGDTTQGYMARLVVEEVDEDEAGFGEAQKRAGDDIDSQETEFYPIFDLEVSTWGSAGDRKGMRIWAPNNETGNPDEELIRDNNAFMYTIQFVERPDENSQPEVIETLRGERSVDFMLKPDAYDDRIDQPMHMSDTVLDAYRDLDRLPKRLGPFGRLHVYQDEIDEVSAKLYTSEYAARKEISNDLVEDWPEPPEDWEEGDDPTDVEGRYLINIFSGKDIDANPYVSIRMSNGNGGASFTRQATHYARGGDDGTMNSEEFDKLVAKVCTDYDKTGVGGSDDANHHFLDTAVWPQSVIYDTGFTLETKKKMFDVMGHRKDIAVVVATQDVNESQNSSSDESSILISLRTAAEAYPESEIYGTHACRALIVGRSGYLIDSRYKDLLPLTIDLADKFAYYMGRGNGVFRENTGPDTPPYNQVSMFKDVNATFQSQDVYNRDWDNGLIWVQHFDRRSLFYPGLQTVYNDPTSVLNSAINMFICIETQKVADRTWRELVGTSNVRSREQFRERSDQLILDQLEGRFDDRVVIEPRTYFTDFDKQLGYSWSTEITLYLPNMMTVGSYTIIARRRVELED